MQQAPIKSWEIYRESTRYLAQGSSTSSKAPAIEDVEPALIVRGSGCRVWDADGNEYIDYRNALGPVTLGYAVPEINEAVSAQLENGIIFGHPHPLEGEVAKLLVETIPCAERVRFLKTGGEALAACAKIARHATRRNKILHCGYNGWLNSLNPGGYRPVGVASAEPTKGVPAAIAELHPSLPWGDLDPWEAAFHDDGDDIAAVMIASAYADLDKGREFLPALRKLSEAHGALMVMDEIVMGFRLAIGGAHEYFDFMPDMAVFGKGMANGMPISAYLGRADLIDSARDLGISSTFGGETLSLAAAKAVAEFYENRRVITHLWETGRALWGAVNHLFESKGVAARFQGYGVCPQLVADGDWAIQFMCACYQQGVSFYHVSYVNYSHKPSDVEDTIVRVERTLDSM
ncbi:MAG: aminotransferase class III-fold pyridoxal phosphate-dependent enzyme [Nitrospiraceae bacterium]|nr:aminotransferase class III-fold pyridoxal phosphate-dependent enzyme [Nitrospiraceae bacterium]